MLQLHVGEQPRLWDFRLLSTLPGLLREAQLLASYRVMLVVYRKWTLLKQPRVRLLGLAKPLLRNVLLVKLGNRIDFITYTHLLERKT